MDGLRIPHALTPEDSMDVQLKLRSDVAAVFAKTLGMPTLWVPHSYPGCSQHAPDEHLLGSVARESLQMMAGLFWDLGETGPALHRQRQARSTA